MSGYHTLSTASGDGSSTTLLEEKIAELPDRLRETELRLAIEASTSRLLALALTRVGEDLDPEDT